MNHDHASLRPARVADADAIGRLAAELGYPAGPAKMLERVAKILDDPGHYVAIAEDGAGSLLGWVHAEHRLSLSGGERVEITGLVVDPAVRRGGVGTALVAAAEKWAASRGAATMRVRSNTARDISHPFYEALGYTRSKTQHVYTRSLGSG